MRRGIAWMVLVAVLCTALSALADTDAIWAPNMEVGGDDYVPELPEEPEEEISQVDRDAAWQRGIAKAAIRNGVEARTFLTDDAGNETEVKVVYMGLARSMVLVNDAEQLVETWRLRWESEAQEDKMLAVVTPTGKVSEAKLHAKPNTKSLVMCRVGRGMVGRVVAVGKDWAKVVLDNAGYVYPLGYLWNDYLQFLPNMQIPYTAGVASVKGRTRGEDTVPVYGDVVKGKGKGKLQIALSTPLSIYLVDETGKWAEVDAGGYHGFIQTKFITGELPQQAAAAE